MLDGAIRDLALDVPGNGYDRLVALMTTVRPDRVDYISGTD